MFRPKILCIEQALLARQSPDPISEMVVEGSKQGRSQCLFAITLFVILLIIYDKKLKHRHF